MNILFLPLNKKETLWGFVIAAAYLTVNLILEATIPFSQYWIVCALALSAFAAIAVTARRFWIQSLKCIRLTGKQMIWKPLLGALVCRVICIFLNDLLLLYGVEYFVSSDWGPMLWDIRGALLETAGKASFWLMAFTVVVILPILEEFLFRGVIFGTLYPKNSTLAIIITVLLFALFHTVPYIGRINDMVYMAIYFFQYIPMGLFLIWLYVSTDSIFAPIAMHLIFNYILVF